MQAPSFIPAGAWLKPDGTVDITVGGALLEGGQGVLMQDALRALKRYASRYGTLLMTTLHPDGRSTTDMVYGDGAIVEYTPNGVIHAPPGIPTVEELEDVFGLPPLGQPPAMAGLRAHRADAFPGRPAFRPLGLTDSYYDSPVFPAAHDPAPAPEGGRFHAGHRPAGPAAGRPMPPPSPFDAPFQAPAGALPDLDLDFFAVHEKAPPPVAPPAQVHRRRGRRPLVVALQLLVIVVIAVAVTLCAPFALTTIQDLIHPSHSASGGSPAGPPAPGKPPTK